MSESKQEQLNGWMKNIISRNVDNGDMVCKPGKIDELLDV